MPSAKTQFAALKCWHEFWESRPVSDITPPNQKAFRQALVTRQKQSTNEEPLGDSGSDRILGVGRAALNFARKQQTITSVPHIFRVQNARAKRSREPKGVPLVPEQMARFLDACDSRHLFLFALIAANTLARPGAILQLLPEQYDLKNGLLDLNPCGREQNNKFRPVNGVTPALARYLSNRTDVSTTYIFYKGAPIKSIRSSFRRVSNAAGLPKGVTPYSFRHGMARELRKRNVPGDQIKLMLGHLPSGSGATRRHRSMLPTIRLTVRMPFKRSKTR